MAFEGRRSPRHLFLRPAVALCAALAASSALGTAASAEPTAAEKEVARTMMDQGDALAARRELAPALKAYEAADAIMAVPTTRIEVARTQAALGLLVEARESALAISRIAARPNEPAPFVQAREEAKRMVEELEQRVPTLAVRVRGARAGIDAAVLVDGAAYHGAEALVPRRVNAGRHLVGVTAPGYAVVTREVTLRERDRASIAFDLHELSEPCAATAPSTSPPSRRPPVLALAAFGVGAAGVAVGIGTGIASLSHASSARDNCVGARCAPIAADDIDTARTLARVSDVAFGVGLVGIATGIIVLLVENDDAAPRRQARSAVGWDF